LSRDLIKRSEFAPLALADAPAGVSARTRLRDLVRSLERAEEDARRRAEEAAARARAEAREEMAREFRASLGALGAAAQALSAAREREKEVALDEIVHLAPAVASKIVRREIRRDDDHVTRLVRRCLRRIPFPAPVRVRLHPDDVARVAAARDALAPDAASLATTLEADRRVERGGCIVETPDFVVDGRARTQLAAAQAAMEGDS
jgi:flagellar biosynthesis/type III secretory pathway protein FliH